MPNKYKYEVLIVFALGTLLFLLFSGFIMFFLIAYQKRRILYQKDKEQLQITFEQELLKSKLEIQESTLKNISQEIHDNIGQVLSLVKLTLGSIDVNSPEMISEKVLTGTQLISKAIQDLRDISKSLNADYITKMGLVKAIEYELAIIKRTGKFQVDFEYVESNAPIDIHKELFIFRIFQETINNIIKHAGASSIKVNLIFDSNKLLLITSDNGKGFEINTLQKSGNPDLGIGFQSMRNRAQLIGAEFDVTSNPGKGTRVTLELPL